VRHASDATDTPVNGTFAPVAWAVEHHRAPAAALHALGWPDPAARLVRQLEVTASALVLGSTQAMVVSDELDVVRRRSGGGAVLVEPAAVAWVDVVVPRDDPLWSDDVGRAFWWLGDAWAAALARLDVAGAEVHRGPLVRTPLSDLVCFAGLGPGEVTVDGRKVVGMAQRRTRAGALFQCAVLLAWNGPLLARALGLDAVELDVTVLKGRTSSEVADALMAQLPED
jgi:lipoate-protein ligase A